MPNKIQIIKCQFCGCNELIEAYQDGYGALTGIDSLLTGCAIRHIICRNCGSVVHSYVDNPEKLLKRSNRRK